MNTEDPKSPLVTTPRTGPYGIRVSVNSRQGFQMTRERRASNAEWPAWLNAAWNTPITDVGAVYPDPNDADRSNGRVQLTDTPHSTRLVQWNDWIIREPDGRLWVTDSADPVIANIDIPAGPALKQAPDMMDEAFRLRRELDDAKAELEEAKRNYAGACQTIAAMHEAATGRVGEAPIRGVVEDCADVRAELLDLRLKLNTAWLNRAAIDQVAETLLNLCGLDSRFREDIRRELRENFGEFGTNERAELEKLRGYYRQIVASLGDDAVISRVRAQAETITRLNAELADQHAKQQRLRLELGALELLKADTEQHADRLASALGWLASACATQVPAVVDAMRAHAMRRGADFQEAGPIQSAALVPAKKLPEGTALLYPGVHQFRGVICARDVIVTPAKLPERTKLVIFDGVLFHVWQAFPMDSGTVLIAAPDSAVMEVDDEEEARAALRYTEQAAADGTLAKLRAFPRARHVGIQPTPAEAKRRALAKFRDLVSEGNHGHALADGIPLPPIPESGVLDVTAPNGDRVVAVRETAGVDQVKRMMDDPKNAGVLEQCGREHAEAMQRIEVQRAQLNPNPPPCPHDTDGDGDCHLCHGKGGCHFRGGNAHVPTREEMAHHDEVSHRCDSCREGFTCWANRTAPCLKRTDPDGVAEDEKGL